MARLTPILLLAALAACATTPKSRYVQASDTVTALTEEVTTLLRAEVISVDQADVAFSLLKTADTRLDEYRDAVARGEPYDRLSAILDTVQDVLRQVSRIIAERSE